MSERVSERVVVGHLDRRAMQHRLLAYCLTACCTLHILVSMPLSEDISVYFLDESSLYTYT